MGRLSLVVLSCFVIVVVLGAVAPATAPVTLTSPTSGSMTPTVPEHAVVPVVSGTPAVGDIVLYETPTRSEPVLHRVVDTTADGTGFLTQGDANPVMDQETGEPPLTADRVYGVVPTVGESPLVIPYVGAALTNPIVLVGLWALLALSMLYSTPMGAVTRGVVVSVPFRTYALVIGTLIVVVLPPVVLATPTVVETSVVTSSTAPADATGIAAPGETATREITLSSPLLPLLAVSAHAEGTLAVDSVETPFGSPEATITVVNEPAAEPTVHDGTVTAYTYPRTLPTDTLRTLAAIHPALAAVASALVVGGPLVVLGLVSDSRRILRADAATISRTRRSRPTRRGGRDR